MTTEQFYDTKAARIEAALREPPAGRLRYRVIPGAVVVSFVDPGVKQTVERALPQLALHLHLAEVPRLQWVRTMDAGLTLLAKSGADIGETFVSRPINGAFDPPDGEGAGTISLSADTLRSADEAIRTLAHELHHAAQWAKWGYCRDRVSDEYQALQFGKQAAQDYRRGRWG